MAAPINRPMTAPEWSMLLTLSVLWGGSFFFVGIAVRELPPLTIVVLRVAIAAVALHLIMCILGERLPKRSDVWTAFAAMGFLNNLVPFVLIVWAQTRIASGVASILNATTPLFTVVLAHWLTHDEKMTGGRLLGVIIGFTGVAVMIGGAALQALGDETLAQVAVLAAGVSYAWAGVFGRRFRAMGVTPLATATGQLTASSLMLIPPTLIVDMPWTPAMPSVHTTGGVVALALMSTALAYILYFRILATAGATNLLLVTFLIPVTAILLGVLVLGEALRSNHLLGMALIGLGLAAIDGRPWRACRLRLGSTSP